MKKVDAVAQRKVQQYEDQGLNVQEVGLSPDEIDEWSYQAQVNGFTVATVYDKYYGWIFLTD